MKFTLKEDIDAPIDLVFAMATDFERFERQAMRRGIEVNRIDAGGLPGLGSEWRIKAPYRGKDRKIASRLEEFDPPNALKIVSRSGGVEGMIAAEFVALSPRSTRVHAELDLTASTLSARLLLQSLKFARSTVTNRLKTRLAKFKASAEEEYVTRRA